MGGGGGCGEAVVGLPGPPDQQHPRNLPQPDHQVHALIFYRGIQEKDSEDIVSAVTLHIYTIYLVHCTQTAETTSPEPFS